MVGMFGTRNSEGQYVMMLQSQLLGCCSHCTQIGMTSKHEYVALLTWNGDTCSFAMSALSGGSGVPSTTVSSGVWRSLLQYLLLVQKHLNNSKGHHHSPNHIHTRI